MDAEILEIERQLAEGGLDPEVAKRLKDQLRILKEWASNLRGLPRDHEMIGRFRRYSSDILDILRRHRLAQRLVRLVGRAGKAFGQVGRIAFRLQPGVGVEVFLTVLLYAPEPGESGSVAVPFDAYDHADTILIKEGDPEQGFVCYVACVYKLAGHFTKGDDPEKKLIHYEGDDQVPEIAMLHKYDCSKPPPKDQEICRKKIYVQVEL